jgi:hypothetical protein
MLIALGACLVLLAALIALRQSRAREAEQPKAGNALDQGLMYLIKDVTRGPREPEIAPPTARPRAPRGTPSDSVLLSSRLPVAIPPRGETSSARMPAIPPEGVVRLATGLEASSRVPTLPPKNEIVRPPSQDEFDEEAPTTALVRDDDR